MARNFDEINFTIGQLSRGRDVVIFDDRGMPSIMVPFQKFKYSEVIEGGSENIHPAFSVNAAEKDVIYVSKFQNIVMNDRAYSLAGKDPRTSVNFDSALQYCRNKGKGWCLMPYSLWCAIALWSKKNGTMPRGNNNYGSDHSHPLEKGFPASYVSGKVARVLTGSGPYTWSHDWTPDGIFDLNGNVWEWCAGMRTNAGEIQVIPYSNIFDAEVSNGVSSGAWKAINKSGDLVEPGSDGTLKWDWVGSKMQLTDKTVTFTEDSGHGCLYKDMTLVDSLTAPELAKGLLLYPDEPGEAVYGGDWHYVNTVGERLPLCGGSWSGTGGAGVFYVSLYDPRTHADGYVGFRSAYCEL